MRGPRRERFAALRAVLFAVCFAEGFALQDTGASTSGAFPDGFGPLVCSFRSGRKAPHEVTDCQVGRGGRGRRHGFRMNEGIALTAPRQSRASSGTA
jgi:hypothetical protein